MFIGTERGVVSVTISHGLPLPGQADRRGEGRIIDILRCQVADKDGCAFAEGKDGVGLDLGVSWKNSLC